MKHWQVWRIWLGMAAGSTAALGCTGSDVPVGEEGDAINASRCFGASTNCTATLQASPIDEPGMRQCDETAEGVLAVDLEIPLFNRGIGCGQAIKQLLVAADGSFWVHGVSSCDYVTTLWLRHYSPEGELIANNDQLGVYAVPTQLERAEMDGSPDGQLFLATYEVESENADDSFSERVTVHQLDGHAIPVAPPVEIAAMRLGVIALGPSKQVTLAGSGPQASRRGVLTRIDSTGEPLWIQNNAPNVGGWGATGIALAPDGLSTVLSARSQTTYGLARFGADGNVLWNRTFTTKFSDGERAFLASDSAGNLIVGAAESDPSEYALLHGLSPDGSSSWTWQAAAMPAIAVHAESGRTAAHGPAGVYVISQDGQGCELYTVPPFVDDSGQQWFRSSIELAFSPDGKLYLHDGNAVTRLTFPETE